MTAAEDLVQDLYVRVASLESDEDIENPSAYLYRLASNLMLDRLRSDRRSDARDSAWSQSQRLELGGEAVLCLFNLGDEDTEWPVPSDLGRLTALGFPGGDADISGASVSLPPFGTAFARIG